MLPAGLEYPGCVYLEYRLFLISTLFSYATIDIQSINIMTILPNSYFHSEILIVSWDNNMSFLIFSRVSLSQYYYKTLYKQM